MIESLFSRGKNTAVPARLNIVTAALVQKKNHSYKSGTNDPYLALLTALAQGALETCFDFTALRIAASVGTFLGNVRQTKVTYYFRTIPCIACLLHVHITWHLLKFSYSEIEICPDLRKSLSG